MEKTAGQDIRLCFLSLFYYDRTRNNKFYDLNLQGF